MTMKKVVLQYDDETHYIIDASGAQILYSPDLAYEELPTLEVNDGALETGEVLQLIEGGLTVDEVCKLRKRGLI